MYERALLQQFGATTACWLQPCARTLARSPRSGAGETTACYVCASTALCLEIRAGRQSQWSTLEALFYCCSAAEIAERPRRCLALLPHRSRRTWPAAGDGCTLWIPGVQQQLMPVLRNWEYQQSSLYAAEFPAAGLVPAKLAQFRSQTEFLLGLNPHRSWSQGSRVGPWLLTPAPLAHTTSRVPQLWIILFISHS